MKDVTFLNSEEEKRERTVNKIQDFQLDPVLSEYFKTPDILKYVECFTGNDIMAVHTMLINKVFEFYPDLSSLVNFNIKMLFLTMLQHNEFRTINE